MAGQVESRNVTKIDRRASRFFESRSACTMAIVQRHVNYCNIWPDLLWAYEARELDDDLRAIFRLLIHLHTAPILDLVSCARNNVECAYRYPSRGTPYLLFRLCYHAGHDMDVTVIALVMNEGDSEMDDEDGRSSTASTP